MKQIKLIGIGIVGLAIMALVLVGGIRQSVFYRQGWEIKSEIVAIDERGTFYTDVGFGSGPSLWKFDLDDPNFGLPDLQIVISDIRKKEGLWPYADLEKVFEGYKYVITYQEYLFDVQVRTIADTDPYIQNDWVNHGHQWQHETACPYEWHSNIDGTGGDRVGENFVGDVYARFVVHPWGLPDFDQPPEGYVFKQYWAGVMNAKMESKDMGKVETGGNYPEYENHVGWVRGLPSDGAGLNMYLDDGSFGRAYSQVPWDSNKVLDPDIKSSVVVQLPFDILAGAYENFNGKAFVYYGAIDNLVPVDYWFTATIRIETFIVKEYQARDPVGPVDPSPVKPPQDYLPYHVPTFWETWGVWLIIGIILFIIFIIILLIFGGMGLGAFTFGCLKINFYRGEIT